MIRVVLDTNVLLSTLVVKVGKPAQVLARRDRFEFLMSEDDKHDDYQKGFDRLLRDLKSGT